MKITLRQMEVFHAVMVAGSVTRAADMLQTSQPTISRELSMLERVIGFELFERRSKRLYATEKAFRLHSAVERSFFGLQQMAQAAHDIREDTGAQIEIACLPMFAQTIMPEVCKSLLTENPTSRISFRSLDHSIQLRELLAARFEIGLVDAGVAVEGVDVTSVFIGDEVCLVPDGHPLSERRVITPADLRGETLVGFTWEDAFRRRYDQMLDEAQLHGSFRIETTTAEAVCALVQRGVGVAIMNPVSALSYVDRGVTVRRLSISIPFSVLICRPISRPLTRLGARAVELTIDRCSVLRLAAEQWPV